MSYQELVSCLLFSLFWEDTEKSITVLPAGKGGGGGGARATRPAKCIPFNLWQWPLPPGIWVQGDPPIGGTGPFWRDWLIMFSKYFFSSKGLEAAPNCIEHEANKMVKMNKYVKKVTFVLWNSIWLMNLRSYCLVFK